MQVGHIIPNPTPDDEAAFFERETETHGVDGRHPEIAAPQGNAVIALAKEFSPLSTDVLASIAVGAAQRIIADMLPTAYMPPGPMPVDRAAHVRNLHDRWSALNLKWRALSANITQLVALERVLVDQWLELDDDLEKHEATSDPVCRGCEITAQDYAKAKALREQNMLEKDA